MNDSHLVRVIDSFERLAKQRDSPITGHRTRSLDQAVERFTAHKLHHHKEVFALAQKAVERGDVRMIKFRKRHCFSAKSFDDVRLARKFRPEHLDGYFALEHQIDAFEHGAHSAFADLVGDLIAADYISY